MIKLDRLNVGQCRNIHGCAEKTITAIHEWSHPEYTITYRRFSDRLVEVWKHQKFQPLTDVDINRIHHELSTIVQGQSLEIRTDSSVCDFIEAFGDAWDFQQCKGYVIAKRMTTLNDVEVYEIIALGLLGGKTTVLPAHRCLKQMVNQMADFLGVSYALTGDVLTPLRC